MNWQSEFDSNGPQWGGNAEAVKEEERMLQYMHELKSGKTESEPVPPRVYEELDLKMEQLAKRGKELEAALQETTDTTEQLEIKSHIVSNNKLFNKILAEYRHLKSL